MTDIYSNEPAYIKKRRLKLAKYKLEELKKYKLAQQRRRDNNVTTALAKKISSASHNIESRKQNIDDLINKIKDSNPNISSLGIKSKLLQDYNVRNVRQNQIPEQLQQYEIDDVVSKYAGKSRTVIYNKLKTATNPDIQERLFQLYRESGGDKAPPQVGEDIVKTPRKTREKKKQEADEMPGLGGERGIAAGEPAATPAPTRPASPVVLTQEEQDLMAKREARKQKKTLRREELERNYQDLSLNEIKNKEYKKYPNANLNNFKNKSDLLDFLISATPTKIKAATAAEIRDKKKLEYLQAKDTQTLRDEAYVNYPNKEAFADFNKQELIAYNMKHIIKNSAKQEKHTITPDEKLARIRQLKYKDKLDEKILEDAQAQYPGKDFSALDREEIINYLESNTPAPENRLKITKKTQAIRDKEEADRLKLEEEKNIRTAQKSANAVVKKAARLEAARLEAERLETERVAAEEAARVAAEEARVAAEEAARIAAEEEAAAMVGKGFTSRRQYNKYMSYPKRLTGRGFNIYNDSPANINNILNQLHYLGNN